MVKNIFYLIAAVIKPEIDELSRLYANIFNFITLKSKNEIADLAPALLQDSVLISFGNSEIIPSWLLNFFYQAINIHAASPEFPGRDPHHWAIYHGATQYGATLHQMLEKVDSGPILAVKLFDVADNDTPDALLSKANHAGLILLRDYLTALSKNTKLETSQFSWGVVKHTRKEFFSMCHISPHIEDSELKRRIKAFSSVGYRNLFTEIHGVRFQYCTEKKESQNA